MITFDEYVDHVTAFASDTFLDDLRQYGRDVLLVDVMCSLSPVATPEVFEDHGVPKLADHLNDFARWFGLDPLDALPYLAELKAKTAPDEYERWLAFAYDVWLEGCDDCICGVFAYCDPEVQEPIDKALAAYGRASK